jgi:hypothetical protein
VHNKPSAEELDSLSVHRLNSSDDPHTVLSRDSSIVPKLVQEVNMLEQDKLGRRVISGITQPYILAICDELFAIGSSNTPNIVYIIDGETDLLKQKISIPDWDPKDKLSEVVFSPRKDLVGVQRIYPKSIIHIYDLITGSEITGLYTWATEFVFSEDGACFAFWEGTVISIFDLNRLSVGVQIANPDTGSVIRVLGLDSERLWIARGMESIKIYSIPDGIFLKEISLHNRPGFGPSLGHFSWKCQTYFFTRREEDLIVSYLVDLDCEKDKVLPTLPMEKRDTGKISPLHSAISYNVRLGAVKSGLNTIAIYTLRTTKVCEVFAVSFAVHAIAFMRDGSLLVLGVEEEDSQRNLLYTVFTHYKKYETDSANEDHKSARPTSEIPLSNGSHKTVTSSTYDILSKVKTPVNPRETVDVRNEKG